MREEFTFPSSDNKTQIHAIRCLPDHGAPKAVLQITHGMVEYIERYLPFIAYLNEQGFAVYGHDHLGHGESVLSEKDWGYFSEDPCNTLVEDMDRLRGIAHTEWPDLPYFMLGHSMGSYLLRTYLAEHGSGLAGAIIMGTGFVPEKTTNLAFTLIRILTFLRGERFRSRMIQSMTYGASYKKFDVTGKEPARSWLTKDTEIVEKYYRDPKCTYVFTLNGYRGLMEAVSRSCSSAYAGRLPKDLPLLLVSGSDDPVGDLGEGVELARKLYLDAGLTDVDCRLYENDRHEILNEVDRERVFADIAGWMSEKLS